MTRTAFALRLVGALAAAGLACGIGTAAAQDKACPAAPAGAPDATFVAAYAASPPSFDETAFTMEVENLLANVYSGDVVQYKPVWWEQYGVCGAGTNQAGEKQVTGRWAESWQESPDGLTWTFNLRRGIKSFAGNEMTCEDLRWSWARGFEMKSVKYFFTKVMNLASIDGVSCPEPHKLQFRITARNPLFLQLLAMNYYGGPFDSTEAKKRASAADPWAKEWLKTNTAGFGPYHVEKHTPGEELILVRNPHFQPKPQIARVVIKIVPDSATRLALLKRGSVDYAMRLRQREYNEVAKDGNLKLVHHAANFIPYFGMVQTNEIMAKPAVRRALAWAVPYEDIHQKVYGGQGEIIRSITPKIFPNQTDEFWPYRTDLDKAKKLLAEAGYPNGFPMTIAYDKAISEMEETCTLIRSNFEKIGIKVQLQGLPSAVYSDSKFQRKQMAHCDNFQWPWIADTGYTAWVYLSHPKDNVMNAVLHDAPELNKLTELMFTTPYGPERTQMDRKIQQLVAEEVPWIFLVNPGWREAMKKGWDGATWYPDNNVHFERLFKTQ
ncbi:ABC transporter substrate-binding protein [Stella sp.]|uniref:ABC transporter substrate-binding protein n=1 Tax=Stella sp. TaxID=2912054 RepID=UPI0035B1B052